MEKIRLLLIEDNQILRTRLACLFKNSPGFELLAAVAGKAETLFQVRALKPGLVLLDMSLGEENSVELARALSRKVPEARVVILGFLPTQGDVLEFLEAGASGFVLKDAPLDEVLKSVRLVGQGKRVIPFFLADLLFSRIVKEAEKAGKNKFWQALKLTRREREVVEHIAEGVSPEELAKLLCISPDAVKNSLDQILKKLALRANLEDVKHP